MRNSRYHVVDSSGRWAPSRAVWAECESPSETESLRQTAPKTVLREIGVILASALAFVLTVNLGLFALHIG